MRIRFQHLCPAFCGGGTFMERARMLSGLLLLFALSMEAVGQSDTPPSRGTHAYTERLTQSDSGSSETAARQAAVREIPIAELAPAAQTVVRDCVSHATTYRRLPVRLIPCTPRLFGLMSNHPDLVVSMWRSLGMTELELREMESGAYSLSDAAGTSGHVQYLYRSREKMLILVDGSYTGPLSVTTLKGRSLVLLTSKYYLGSDGKPYVRCQADCFVKIENEGAEVIIRLLEPIVSGIVDNNFIHTASFVGDVYEASLQNSESIRALAQQMGSIRSEVVQEFVTAVADVQTESVSLQMTGRAPVSAQDEASANSGSVLPPEPVSQMPDEMALPALPAEGQGVSSGFDPELLRRRTVDREGPAPRAMPDPSWR